VGEGGLFDREERPHLIAAGTDDTNSSSDDKEKQVTGTGKSQTSSGHKNRADDQHAPPSDTVRSRCQIKRDNYITD